MIQDQTSNRHTANGYEKLVHASKREAVQFLVAKNLAINHLPLDAVNCKLQTILVPRATRANVTARTRSREILRFAVCGLRAAHEEPCANTSHTYKPNMKVFFLIRYNKLKDKGNLVTWRKFTFALSRKLDLNLKSIY